jgi:hypothetical protein
VTFNITVSTSGPGFSQFRWTEAAAKWAAEVGPIVRTEIERKAPVAQAPGGGRLRDSTRFTKSMTSGLVRITFSAGTPYARYVVDGTPPHLIQPRSARALHWRANGASHFARVVHHPGTRPNPYARRAIEPMLPLIQRRLQESVIESMRRG